MPLFCLYKNILHRHQHCLVQTFLLRLQLNQAAFQPGKLNHALGQKHQPVYRCPQHFSILLSLLFRQCRFFQQCSVQFQGCDRRFQLM